MKLYLCEFDCEMFPNVHERTESDQSCLSKQKYQRRKSKKCSVCETLMKQQHLEFQVAYLTQQLMNTSTSSSTPATFHRILFNSKPKL
jgi:hypothetical protein